MKRIAIVQSSYIPWKGFFDLIASVDEFVLYDEVQFTRRDWRNRNQIKTPSGLQWLTIPVKVKGRYYQSIRETEVTDTDWRDSHWKSLELNYRRAKCFSEVAKWLEPLYRSEMPVFLNQINRRFIEAICCFLGISTIISDSTKYDLRDGQSERLAHICAQAGATEYVSGPSARAYLDEAVFHRVGVGVVWFDYRDYPVYPQLWGEFKHQVSIVDLLFNCGSESPCFMRYVRT